MTRAFDRIGIDPGVHQCAYACALEGTLVSVGFMRPPEFLAFGNLQGVRGVVEIPRIYPKGPKGELHKRPQDLMDLSRRAGGAEDVLEALGAEVRGVFPRDWKGQLKKPPHHRRVWASLTPAERRVVAAVVGMSTEDIKTKIDKACERLARTGKVTGYEWSAHNVLDAAGLVVWDLRRVVSGNMLLAAGK